MVAKALRGLKRESQQRESQKQTNSFLFGIARSVKVPSQEMHEIDAPS
jgi:hypothetical protein